MKKSISLLLIAFVAFSCKSEQSHLKSDIETANLKGKVWKIDRTIHDTQYKCACSMKTECNQSKYVYNEKGNLIKAITIDENGSVNDSSKYVYNRHGLCLEITKFTGNKLAGKEVPILKGERVTGVKIYDENGRIESILNYVYSGYEISEEITLNSKGDVASSIQNDFLKEKDDKGNIIRISKFKRNASNDIIECLFTVTKDNKEYKITYEYEYDKAGNWIKQTKFYDNQIVNIVVRNIEYYTA
jgi:hypothetical protein